MDCWSCTAYLDENEGKMKYMRQFHPDKAVTDTEFSSECRAAAGDVLPPPTRINLSTAEDIRREMSRVYREARSKELDTREAGRLVYMLGQIAKAYEIEVIEERLAALEEANLSKPRRLGVVR